MTSGVSLGVPHFDGTRIVVPVVGRIEREHADDLDAALRPYLRPPEPLILDFSGVLGIDTYGVQKFLRLRIDYPRCPIILINVPLNLWHHLSTSSVAACKIQVEYQSEVA